MAGARFPTVALCFLACLRVSSFLFNVLRLCLAPFNAQLGRRPLRFSWSLVLGAPDYASSLSLYGLLRPLHTPPLIFFLISPSPHTCRFNLLLFISLPIPSSLDFAPHLSH